MTFMTSLMKELAKYVNKVEEQADASPVLCQPVDNLARRSSTWVPDTSRLCGSHYPSRKSSYDARGTCRACQKGVISTYCVECKTFLHIDGEGRNSCFWRFHNQNNF